MNFSFVASRAGGISCRAGGLWLHSRFDPAGEAERLAAETLGGSRPSTVVLLGPCLDYLSAAVRKIVPRARLIAIQFSSEFKGKEAAKADYQWYPDSAVDIDSFLDTVIDEESISGISVITWPPAEAAFPAEYQAASSALRASLDRLASSFATIKVFGGRWIANACRFFVSAESLASCRTSEAPCVVAASGPTLRKSLQELAPFRADFVLVSVSSALSACRHEGLEPDLVVATDGGNWSRLHLYPLASRGLILASPLTALPSASLSRCCPFLIINQGGFVESRLIPMLGAHPDSIWSLPPHGTVSGTALVLASRLCRGPIIAAGFDLAAFGDFDHARPHGFDSFISSSQQRLSPDETLRWKRTRELCPDRLSSDPRWSLSRSLLAYASGLDASARLLRGRLFRLNPSPLSLSNFENIDASDLHGIFSSARRNQGKNALMISTNPLPSPHHRASFLAAALENWRATAAETADRLASGNLVTDAAAAELLRSIDIVDYAAARRAVLSGGDPRPAASELKLRAIRFFSELEERLTA